MEHFALDPKARRPMALDGKFAIARSYEARRVLHLAGEHRPATGEREDISNGHRETHGLSIALWAVTAAPPRPAPTDQLLLDLVAPGPISCVCEVPRVRQPRHPRHRLARGGGRRLDPPPSCL